MATLLKVIRDKAATETDKQRAYYLRDAADNLNTYIRVFSDHPTAENLSMVNGQWAYACRLINYEVEFPEGPKGGAMPVPEDDFDPMEADDEERKVA